MGAVEKLAEGGAVFIVATGVSRAVMRHVIVKTIDKMRAGGEAGQNVTIPNDASIELMANVSGSVAGVLNTLMYLYLTWEKRR